MSKRDKRSTEQLLSQRLPVRAVAAEPPDTEHKSLTKVAISYEGILPPPQMLRQFDDACPGAADRIITMAEEQARHRRHLESTVVEGGVRDARRGQGIGGVLALVIIVGAIYLISVGKDAQGLAALVAAIAGLAGVFVYGRRKEAEERQQKRDAFADAPVGPFK